MSDKPTLLNNRYQVLSTLGRGGFGETFLATDTYLPSQKKCVVKQLKPIIQESNIPEWMETRFEQEARILEHLGQENSQIPHLYAYFSEAGKFYLVQEWIDGITLKEKVSQHGTLSEQEVKSILEKILPVIDYVHGQKIIHRDIKPDNIILRSQNNIPVLIDFGAVKEAMTTTVNLNNNSAYSLVIGTAGYMSPEQMAGHPVYSSDIYSLGLTAVYLLTGKSPQNLEIDSDTGEILWRKSAPHLHSQLATLIDRAIRYHPSDRISSAKEMLTALSQQSCSNSKVNSTVTTVAVLGRKSPQDNENRAITSTQTVVVQNNSQQKQRQHIGKLLLPLVALSLVAIGSFIFALRVILEQNSTSEVLTKPDKNLSPPYKTNNTYPLQKETNIEPETRIESNPQLKNKPLETVEENQPQTQPEKPFQEWERREQELEREQEKREQELEKEKEKRKRELERERERREKENRN